MHNMHMCIAVGLQVTQLVIALLTIEQFDTCELPPHGLKTKTKVLPVANGNLSG